MILIPEMYTTKHGDPTEKPANTWGIEATKKLGVQLKILAHGLTWVKQWVKQWVQQWD